MDESLDLSFELWLLCILTPRKQKVISYRGEPVTFGPRGNGIQLLIMVVCIPHILWTVGDRVSTEQANAKYEIGSSQPRPGLTNAKHTRHTEL